MTCGTCNQDLGACTCADADARLRSIAYDPEGHVAFKWCRTCDKHYARCRCAAPRFYVLVGGREWPMPEGGYRNAEGGRTIPDLTAR